MSNRRRLALWSEIESDQTRLHALIAGQSDEDLATRPTEDAWSILEVLRHLLFAEQAHIGRFDPGGPQWSPVGYTPATMREARRRAHSEQSAPSVEVVLTEWRAVHAGLAARLGDRHDDVIEHALTRNLKHLRSHIRSVERALARQTKG